MYACLKKSRNDGQVTLRSVKCENLRSVKLKEGKFFRQHKLKTSYPLGLNQKEGYLF